MSYESIQTTDHTDTATAATNQIAKRVERRRYQESLEVEARVRTLLDKAENAIVGDLDREPGSLLTLVFWYLWHDPDRREVLATSDGRLDQETKRQFLRLHRLRDRGRRLTPAQREYEVLVDVAKGLGYLTAVTDKTSYAPVSLEVLEATGASSVVDEETVSPVGRIRAPKDSTIPLEQRAAEIPHHSCDHILTVALPRQGKDSTNARICGNLKDEHGYKWVSILDDGRNELPMVAVPNDEDPIRESLERLGQSPKAYETEVFVPAMPGLPDRLPGNHVPFTIGVDDLTPELVLRLAGITSINANTERRIRTALDKTLAGGGSVERLCDRLQEMSGEMEATIQVTELADDDSDDTVREISYEMEEDKALREASNALAQFAGDGLIEDKGADTNLDMADVLSRQEAVAVLNCNFLEEGNEALRFTIMDLWMQLIWRARDQNSRLPRVALEVRELKNIAPSKLTDTKYSSEAKATRQTLFKIASQGGSRRVLLVGSTQKINDVYKAIRSNMATKIILRNDDEGVNTLADNYHFSQEQRRQIKNFKKGQGMILEPGARHWPVQFAGARCGLGDGDRDWLDRYGLAWGARVRESPHDKWQSRHSPDWWVETNALEVVEDEIPDPGEWFLLDEDFPDGVGPADVDRDLVDDVLVERREFQIPSELSLRDVSTIAGERTEILRDLDEAQADELEENFAEFDVPKTLRPWARTTAEKRERMLSLLEAIRDGSHKTQASISRQIAIAPGTVGTYLSDNDALATAAVKDGESGVWSLTPIGEEALSIPWHDVVVDD